ncbi:cellular morphogenesis protein [Ophiocordyceps camponoti-floridani]|uniref:Cellular morphogenesis protein n=1 Tax=Ophiocordyceps camponoti-floridani TaxID=2030778 RepID=A0A8H4Q6L7_9HYPO|nr:cellular morphogenesis protein [Ophiocordyceps camponoti-floridani]
MWLPFPRGRAVRPPDLAVLLLLLVDLTYAIDFKPAPAANLDLANLGEVVVAGDFSGISLYQYQGQRSADLSVNGSQSLLARLPSGVLAPVATTDASIQSMCALRRKNGDLEGVIIGGNFTSLDGIQSTAVALFNPSTSEFKPVSGLEGQVTALYCDQDRELVYIGGRFHGANSTNALAWSSTRGLVDLPFAGFNGPVNAITKSSNGHIIFGGNFTGLGNATTPSRPDEQVINLSSANTSATNSASTTGFSDPNALACSGGSDGPGRTWLLADKTPGTWDAAFGYVFQPTKLRLWNTRQDGRGTKTFRFLAFPINGIMNLTYVDPATGQNATCTSECPLSHDANVAFQDFHFVNRVGMNSFQIAISDWYGNGAGLAGIQLFHDDIYAYAISDFNEPTCGGNKLPSKASATGPWQHSPSVQSNSDYLTAKLTSSSPASLPSVVFFPSIRESGNYSVNIYTPGCIPDGSCSTRGRVNVTGIMSPGSTNTISTTLFQTNNFDKYDQIYFGYVEKSSDGFQPSVTITPLPDQDMPLTVVAQRIGFTLVNSTGGLNGLFDFNPDNDTVDVSKFEQSPINKLGSGFQRSAGVSSLATWRDSVYIAGDFRSDGLANVAAIGGRDNEVQSLDGGLNGRILDMHLEDNKLYVVGDFTDKQTATQDGLSHVAVFDTRANTWAALGGGVDGPVQHVEPLVINTTADATETAIALSGTFSSCRGFDKNAPISVDGFAVWVPSKNNWLSNLEGSHPAYNGVLSAALVDLPQDNKLYGGSIESSQVGANGAVTLSDKGLASLASVQLVAAAPTSNKSRRDELSDGARGVVTGTFYNNDDANVTVLAGHFSARATDGSTMDNLILIDGHERGAVSGLGPGVSKDSTFTTVAMRGSVLYAGGRVSGTVAERPIGGIVAYDVKAKTFGNQPAPLSGGQGTVSAITVRPGTAEVYVAGSFQKAGALDCPGVCLYNADSDQWTQPGNGLSGQVSCLMWSSDSTLLAGGDMRANGTDKQYLTAFSVKRQAWMSFPGTEAIPGPIRVMTPASSDGNQVWIAGKSAQDGSVYLMKFDGKEWKKAPQTLPAKTVLRSLQVFTLTKSHGKTEMLDDNQGLMVTGSMELAGVGPVSAVLYNGTDYVPYALTTHSGLGSGSVGKIFTQRDDFFSSDRGHMSLVFVVLIGLAISLALILLIVLAGIALDRLRKKREGYTRAPTSMHDRDSGIDRIPPRELLESLGKTRPGVPHV